MKTELFSVEGKKVKEIEVPSVFSVKIREDIVKKAFEAEKRIQPYGPSPTAGRRHSASGRIRHIRHKWRTAYGRGISRVPRKTMWRRGTQFYWIGAEVSGTRGGRQAHPPVVEKMMQEKRLNKKEAIMALNSAIASTSNENMIKKRYERLSEVKNLKLPIVIESNLEKIKTKNFLVSVEKILGNLSVVAGKTKSVRAGKGKLRNRKYQKSKGVLLVTGNDENIKTKAVDSRKVNELMIGDLYPLGRLAIYTEKAIKDIEKMGEEK
jgi:large subunit ribosomal protein L4e